MGKATDVITLSGWTIGILWHTWFGIAGRAIRRLYPRNPVPRAYCELCEVIWYSCEALTTYYSAPFGGDFSIITYPGISGRATRRL